MKVDETPYRTLRKIQLSEEKFPLLTKIDKNKKSNVKKTNSVRETRNIITNKFVIKTHNR